MNIKQDLNMNLFYLSCVLQSLDIYEYPKEIKEKILELNNMVDTLTFVRIPDDYAIIDEKCELTFYLKKE